MEINQILATKRAWRKQRNAEAQSIRSMRRSLYSPLPYKQEAVFPAFTLGACLLLASLMFIASCVMSRPAHAEIPEDKAIRTLIGEASNQGEKGMICVAEVLRRQGSLKGFYGYKAKHVDHEPAYVWAMARKAWLASANTNYTHGANHFENVKAFGCPSWVKRCVETYRFKDHVFYKEA